MFPSVSPLGLRGVVPPPRPSAPPNTHKHTSPPTITRVSPPSLQILVQHFLGGVSPDLYGWVRPSCSVPQVSGLPQKGIPHTVLQSPLLISTPHKTLWEQSLSLCLGHGRRLSNWLWPGTEQALQKHMFSEGPTT